MYTYCTYCAVILMRSIFDDVELELCVNDPTQWNSSSTDALLFLPAPSVSLLLGDVGNYCHL